MDGVRKESDLSKYLKAVEKKDAGWRARYERSLCGAADYLYLAGHYAAMLDYLIDTIGYDRVVAIVTIVDEMSKTILRASDVKTRQHQ